MIEEHDIDKENVYLKCKWNVWFVYTV